MAAVGGLQLLHANLIRALTPDEHAACSLALLQMLGAVQAQAGVPLSRAHPEWLVREEAELTAFGAVPRYYGAELRGPSPRSPDKLAVRLGPLAAPHPDERVIASGPRWVRVKGELGWGELCLGALAGQGAPPEPRHGSLAKIGGAQIRGPDALLERLAPAELLAALDALVLDAPVFAPPREPGPADEAAVLARLLIDELGLATPPPVAPETVAVELPPEVQREWVRRAPDLDAEMLAGWAVEARQPRALSVWPTGHQPGLGGRAVSAVAFSSDGAQAIAWSGSHFGEGDVPDGAVWVLARAGNRLVERYRLQLL